MGNLFDLYIGSLELLPPATLLEIERVENALEMSLPDSYRDFLKISNGAEGSIGKDQYLMLWKVEDLLELNEAYGVDEFAEGLFLIGSDGADIAYGFDRRTRKMNVISVPFIGMSLEEVSVVGADFLGFIKNL